MSLEAWGDEGDESGGFTEDRVCEIAGNSFVRGAQICREMMARFVEQGGDFITARSIRANWNPAWGNDPGEPLSEIYDQIRNGFDPMSES